MRNFTPPPPPPNKCLVVFKNAEFPRRIFPIRILNLFPHSGHNRKEKFTAKSKKLKKFLIFSSFASSPLPVFAFAVKKTAFGIALRPGHGMGG
jgi:hypothetical protein